jgi:hypothetical protein
MFGRIYVALLLAISTIVVTHGSTSGQSTIHVGAGQVLTHSDLLGGNFNGSSFALGPATKFEINAGGTIGPIGEFHSAAPNVPIDLKGSTINLNSGGFSGDAISGLPSIVSNGTMNVYPGATLLPTIVQVGSLNILVSFEARAGANINFHGGLIQGAYDARSGSTTNFYGGYFYHTPEFFGGSVINISGGHFRAMPLTNSSSITLTGGEFKLNGAPLPAMDQSLGSPAGVLSGTLSDGTPFLFPRFNSNAQVSLKVVDLPAATPSPMVVDDVHPFEGSGLRVGQSMSLRDGGVLGAPLAINGESFGARFTVDSALLSIEGGSVAAEFLDVINSSVRVSDGTIQPVARAFAGSILDISGGTVGGTALNKSAMNMSGGYITSFSADNGSVVNITGGEVGPFSRIGAGSTANISGGLIETRPGINLAFGADSGSTLNLLVRSALLNGVPIDFGASGTNVITSRNFDQLQVILADGNPFELTLFQDPHYAFGISEQATLAVTLVPEPFTMQLVLWVAALIGRARPAKSTEHGARGTESRS